MSHEGNEGLYPDVEWWDDEIAESAYPDFKRDAYADLRKPPEKREEDGRSSGATRPLIGVEEDSQGRASSIPGRGTLGAQPHDDGVSLFSSTPPPAFRGRP